MSFNYSKLLGKIIEKFNCQFNFAIALGISERTLSQKLNGHVGWKQLEMVRCLELLDVNLSEIEAYFFNIKT